MPNKLPARDDLLAHCPLFLTIPLFLSRFLPLRAGGETKVEGCVLCHDLLNGCTELAKGRHKHVAVARQDFAKRNRGRGGRGRGRGRGRGGKSGANPLMSFEDF